MNEPVQLDLFTYTAELDSDQFKPERIDECAGCRYNRPLNAWGDQIEACWYSRDNPETELYDGDHCSRYDDSLYRDATGNPMNGMYYERSSGKFVSFVCGRRHFEITPGRCLGDKEWKEKTMRERAI